MLRWSHNNTRRIRTLAGIQAYTPQRRNRGRTKLRPDIEAPENRLRRYYIYRKADLPRAGYSFSGLTRDKLKIWVEDFTYVPFRGKFYYLAAVLNLNTREVIGWAFGERHDADLVCNAFADALKHRKAPNIIHSDRGAEYLSEKHLNLCKVYGVPASASGPGQPWQNGFMERFFNTFKEEQ